MPASAIPHLELGDDVERKVSQQPSGASEDAQRSQVWESIVDLLPSVGYIPASGIIRSVTDGQILQIAEVLVVYDPLLSPVIEDCLQFWHPGKQVIDELSPQPVKQGQETVSNGGVERRGMVPLRQAVVFVKSKFERCRFGNELGKTWVLYCGLKFPQLRGKLIEAPVYRQSQTSTMRHLLMRSYLRKTFPAIMDSWSSFQGRKSTLIFDQVFLSQRMSLTRV